MPKIIGKKCGELGIKLYTHRASSILEAGQMISKQFEVMMASNQAKDMFFKLVFVYESFLMDKQARAFLKSIRALFKLKISLDESNR